MNENVLENTVNEKSFSPVVEIPMEFVHVKDMDSPYKGPLYKTGYVAEQLGVDRQTIIRYARTFEEFLDIGTTPAGDRQYTEYAIKQLAFIINDRIANHRTMTSELEYLQSTYGSKHMQIATQGIKAFEEMFNALRDSIVESNTNLVGTILSDKAEIQKNNELLYQELDKRLLRQEEAYAAALSAKEHEIEMLRCQLAEKEEMLESTKKKKPFFWRKKP